MTVNKGQMTVDTLTSVLLDALFPPRCAGCGVWHRGLFCADCQALLRPILPPLCHVCGKPFDPLSRPAPVCELCRDNRYHPAPAYLALRSVYSHEGPPREALHRFKYAGKTALARALAQRLQECLRHPPEGAPPLPWQGVQVIVPVPLHPKRQRERGFNQSHLLARELGQMLGVPAVKMLRRERHTPSQVGLHARERARNVQGAFGLDLRLSPEPRGPVLLLDDVCTTGATLQECARVLNRAGCREVYALTFTRQLAPG